MDKLLSEHLQEWRIERPSEWKMDEFIRLAASLEAQLKEQEDYITHHNDWASACEIAVLNADNAADASYWEHQLLTLAKLAPPVKEQG